MQYLINSERKIIEKNYRTETLTREKAFPRNTDENLIFFSGELPKYWAIKEMEVVELSKFEAYQNGLYKLSEGEKVENEEIVAVEKPTDYHIWDYDKMEWVEDLEALRTSKELELNQAYETHLETYTFPFTLSDGREVYQGISNDNRNDLSQLITSMNNEINLEIYKFASEFGEEPPITERVKYMEELTSFYIFRSSEMTMLNLLELQEIGCEIDKEYKAVYIANKGYASMIYTYSFDELLNLDFSFEDRIEETEETEEVPVEEVYNKWDIQQVYDYGDKVSYSGVNYIANFWTQGQIPSENVGGTEKPWSII